MKRIKDYLLPTFILFVICSVSALLLGATNEITKGRIAENDAKAAKEAMETVMPGCTFGNEGENEYGSYAVAYDNEGNVAGYAVTAIGKGGYDGEIKLMVGITVDGKVSEIGTGAAISVLDNSETPSVGGKVIKNLEWFKSFIGLEGGAALTKSGGKIDAVSGATKTSTGITDGVNNALKCYSEIKGVN
ncbi:MAG: FMN-binding protein [Clostridiales bacterium]|nr:FMN-binding protein [Clostridiales bacterium]